MSHFGTMSAPDLIAGLRTLLDTLRLLAVGVLVAGTGLATLAWAVRSRRINPFGAPARFVRQSIDPVLAPLDRRLARAGVVGAQVPWWGLLALLLTSAAVIYLVGFVANVVTGAYLAANAGPRGLAMLAIGWTFALLQLALLVRVVTSWIGGGHTVIARLAARLTDWFLLPLRRVLPPLGPVDLSPIVAWFLLNLVEGAVMALL